MSVYKNSREVKEFKFGQLVPSENTSHSDKATDFELRSLKDAAAFKNNLSAEVIRTEREHESGKRFSIDPRVREHRGLVAQEQEDFERSVEAEVQRRVELIKEQAFEEGFLAGQQEGMDKAYQEAIVNYDQKVAEFSQFIDEVTLEKKRLIEDSREAGYKLVKNLTKWVILKEVEDKEYIGRLLEKLILEINTKSNLLVRVNQEDFSHIPEVLDMVEAKLGKLTNVRVEVEQDMNNKGIILESEVGVIDGSLESQLASIDKLFESVSISSEGDHE